MNRIVILCLVLLTPPLYLVGCGKSEPAREASETQDPHDEQGEEHAETNQVALTPAQIKSASIQLLTAGPAKVRETLSLYGVIAPNAESVRDVTARYPGVLRSVSKRVGDAVREGETLATVESNESLRTYSIVAPLTGVVTMRKANPGEYSGESVLFTVADLSTVWVELSLFPRDVSKVRTGQSVRVKSPDTELAAEGKIVYVAPFSQSANQTLTARVLLANAERRWAPGLYVTAEVTLAEADTPLAVRNEALQTLEGRSVVFVQADEGFEARAVALGRSDSVLTEVRSGITAGEVYVAANSFILKAELGKGEAAHED